MTNMPTIHTSLRQALAALILTLAGATVFAQVGPAADPPGRVAYLNLFEGPVSFATGGQDNWSAAVLNRPLTSGDRLWVAEGARAEMHAGSTALRLGAGARLDFGQLDDNVTQLQLNQGTLSVRLRALFDGQRFQINTPNLAFSIAQPGEYRIDVDPARDTTRVKVLSGYGTAYGVGPNGGSTFFALTNAQQVSFSGIQLAQVDARTAAMRDDFDQWASSRDQAEDQSVSARYVSREIIGYSQLDSYGDWRIEPAFGAVWIPRVVTPGWAPYRAGHWARIPPWGWTWIDDAPWGFAPSHYGRWIQLGPRWAWVPGPRIARPVYAPALVTFLDERGGRIRPGTPVGEQGGPSHRWVPLAPHEHWQPAYPASPQHLGRINAGVPASPVPAPPAEPPRQPRPPRAAPSTPVATTPIHRQEANPGTTASASPPEPRTQTAPQRPPTAPTAHPARPDVQRNERTQPADTRAGQTRSSDAPRHRPETWPEARRDERAPRHAGEEQPKRHREQNP